MRDRLCFIGVSTSGSSIMGLFPRWAELLGLNAEVTGRDVPLGAPPERFRDVVEEIASTPTVRGALVTTHKVDIFEHAHDLFAEVDPFARLCGEVSCISKRDGALVAHAKDPITAGRTLEEMIGPDHWQRTGGQAACLGAGGAGIAIVLYLLGLEDPPERIVLTDVNERRIAAAQRAHAEAPSRSGVDHRLVSRPPDSDRIVSSLPSSSLVINATGMGKDRPGSPVTDAARFPHDGIAWDLNYRGELDFLRQARAQRKVRALAVHDGWRYFLHGWSEVIAEVFSVEITDDRFAAMASAAEELRISQSRN
jgi:shikimate dehydrogenase